MTAGSIFSHTPLYRILPLVLLAHVLLLVNWQRSRTAEPPIALPHEGRAPLSIRLVERARPIPEVKKRSRSAPVAAPAAETPPSPADTASDEGVGVAKEITAGYFAELRALLERHKHYPPVARRLGQQGRAEVSFSVLEDGTIVSIELASPTPFEMLNRAAILTVQRVGRFKPIPVSFNTHQLRFRVPIDFAIN